jgi:RluA family pseudouridine synthase
MRKPLQSEKKYKRGGQVRVERGKPPVKKQEAPETETPKPVRPPQYIGVYKVNHSDELLEFLLRKCNTSRNNVKSYLSRGQVLVNGSLVTQFNFVLAKDDEVEITKNANRVEAAEKRLQSKTTARPVRLPFPILFENDEFIAVDKPAGLLSVESDKQTECAFGYVMKYLRSQSKTARPFILHRIDKETSGVLIFAKDVKIHSMLKLKWNELVTAREYYAVAEGTFEKKSDTVVSYLKENANNLVYVTQDKTAQKAVTNYEVVKENAEYSLVKVNIETGRKNQIRVQMQALGHPIVGDDKYGFTKDPLKRLGLHASKLEFTHPVSGETVTIRSTVPATFWGLF